MHLSTMTIAVFTQGRGAGCAPALDNILDAGELEEPGGALLGGHLGHDTRHLSVGYQQPPLLAGCGRLHLSRAQPLLSMQRSAHGDYCTHSAFSMRKQHIATLGPLPASYKGPQLLAY